MMYQPATGRGLYDRPFELPYFSAQPFFPVGAFGQRNRIENRRALVAQDGEGAADRARRFILTVAARRVEIDARAGDERDRSFHRPHDLTERDLLGERATAGSRPWDRVRF